MIKMTRSSSVVIAVSAVVMIRWIVRLLTPNKQVRHAGPH